VGWFRSNVRSGAWCALFALALQLALSFGHIHLDGFGRYPAGALRGSTSAQTATAAPDEPAGNPTSHAGRDLCLVCRLIHLAGTLLPAGAASLPLPMTISLMRLTIGTDREHAGSRPPLFQARAPPIA
jgi:hypothetical protein